MIREAVEAFASAAATSEGGYHRTIHAGSGRSSSIISETTLRELGGCTSRDFPCSSCRISSASLPLSERCFEWTGTTFFFFRSTQDFLRPIIIAQL